MEAFIQTNLDFMFSISIICFTSYFLNYLFHFIFSQIFNQGGGGIKAVKRRTNEHLLSLKFTGGDELTSDKGQKNEHL